MLGVRTNAMPSAAYTPAEESLHNRLPKKKPMTASNETLDTPALVGVLGLGYAGLPLAPEEVVAAYKKAKKKVDDREAAIKEFLHTQATQLSEILAAKTARYLQAAARPEPPPRRN